MLRVLQIIFAVITALLAGYGVITKDFQLGPYMILFLGLTMLVMGLQEFKKNRNPIGWVLVGVFVFSLVVSIQSLINH